MAGRQPSAKRLIGGDRAVLAPTAALRYKKAMSGDGELAGSGRLPPYLVAMVRRDPPESARVVPGSTPVVAFGDPARARVATLGINPSRNEFLDGQGGLLDGSQRRLATLRSLAAARLDALTDGQVAEVVADCAAYFQRNPYRLWFDPLDQLLGAALGASYYDGTACHLDLVQWATDPVWGQLSDERARQALIDDGVPHLRAQLAANPDISVVLCNGRQVIDQVRDARLADLREVGVIRNGQVTCRLYSGPARVGTARWIAWSANLQSSWGVSSELKRELADWVEQAQRETDGVGRPSPPATASAGTGISRGIPPARDARSRQARTRRGAGGLARAFRRGNDRRRRELRAQRVAAYRRRRVRGRAQRRHQAGRGRGVRTGKRRRPDPPVAGGRQPARPCHEGAAEPGRSSRLRAGTHI